MFLYYDTWVVFTFIMMIWLNNNFTIYFVLALAILPETCDDFYRQKTYLEFSLFHPFLFNFTSFYFPIVLFSF